MSICLLWISGGIAQAAEDAPGVFAAVNLPPQFNLVPPGSLGRIADYYNSETPNSKLVILIQDLHAHYGVQKNIAGILDFLSKRLASPPAPLPMGEGGRRPGEASLPFVVAVEGAQGPIDSSVMALFPDQKIKQSAADYLMREGELSGAEYFAVMRGIPNLLTGVENGEYYNLNRELFRKTLADRQELVSLLKGMQADIQPLEDRLYGSALKAFQKTLQSADAGTLSSSELLGYLIRQSGTQHLDWRSGFPELARYAVAAGQADRQSAGLPTPEELRRVTTDFLSQSQTVFTHDEREIVASLAKKSNSTAYYLYLRDLIYKHQLFLAAPVELSRYLEFVHASASMDMNRIQYEIQELAFRVEMQTATTGSEKDLVQVEHDLASLIRVADLQSTETEVKAFGPRMNQFIALCQTLMTSNGISSFDATRVRRLVSSSIDYYAMALMRNQPMVDNTLALIQNVGAGHRARPKSQSRHNSKPLNSNPGSLNPDVGQAQWPAPTGSPNVAVLVTGGFHTEPLTELLRQRNVSYIVITPTVESLTDADHDLYIKRLNGQLLTDEEALAAAQKPSDGRGATSPFWIASLKNSLVRRQVGENGDEGKSLAVGLFGLALVPHMLDFAAGRWMVQHHVDWGVAAAAIGTLVLPKLVGKARDIVSNWAKPKSPLPTVPATGSVKTSVPLTQGQTPDIQTPDILQASFPNYTTVILDALTQSIASVNHRFHNAILVAAFSPRSSVANNLAMPYSDIDHLILIHDFATPEELAQAKIEFNDDLRAARITVEENSVIGAYHWISRSGIEQLLKKNRSTLSSAETNTLRDAGLAMNVYPKAFKGTAADDLPELPSSPIPNGLHNDEKIQIRRRLFAEWNSLSPEVHQAIQTIHMAAASQDVRENMFNTVVVNVPKSILSELENRGFIRTMGAHKFKAVWLASDFSVTTHTEEKTSNPAEHINLRLPDSIGTGIPGASLKKGIGIDNGFLGQTPETPISPATSQNNSPTFRGDRSSQHGALTLFSTYFAGYLHYILHPGRWQIDKQKLIALEEPVTRRRGIELFFAWKYEQQQLLRHERFVERHRSRTELQRRMREAAVNAIRQAVADTSVTPLDHLLGLLNQQLQRDVQWAEKAVAIAFGLELEAAMATFGVDALMHFLYNLRHRDDGAALTHGTPQDRVITPGMRFFGPDLKKGIGVVTPYRTVRQTSKGWIVEIWSSELNRWELRTQIDYPAAFIADKLQTYGTPDDPETLLTVAPAKNAPPHAIIVNIGDQRGHYQIAIGPEGLRIETSYREDVKRFPNGFGEKIVISPDNRLDIVPMNQPLPSSIFEIRFDSQEGWMVRDLKSQSTFLNGRTVGALWTPLRYTSEEIRRLNVKKITEFRMEMPSGRSHIPAPILMDGDGRILAVLKFAFPTTSSSSELHDFSVLYREGDRSHPSTATITKGPDDERIREVLHQAFADAHVNLEASTPKPTIPNKVGNKTILRLADENDGTLELMVRGDELQIIVPGDSTPRIYHGSQEPRVTIGSGDYNDIRINHKYISNRHLILEFHDGQWHFRDFLSTNGTFDGQGQRVTEGVLESESTPTPSADQFRQALSEKDFAHAESLLAQLQSQNLLSPYDRINLPNALRREKDRERLAELLSNAEAAYERIETISESVAEAQTPKVIEEAVQAMEPDLVVIRDAFRAISELDVAIRVTESKTVKRLSELQTKASGLKVQALHLQIERLTNSRPSVAPSMSPRTPAELSTLKPMEFKKAMEGIPVHFDGKDGDRDVLKDSPPAYKIDFNGVTYYLSKPYISEAEGRPAFIVYIHRKNPENGHPEVFVRNLYKSKSQTVMWRFASHKAGHWIGKGMGEESTDAPVEIIPHLHKLIQESQSSPEGLSERAGFYEVLEEAGLAAPAGFEETIMWKTSLGGQQKREKIKMGGFSDLDDPPSLEFFPGFEPDYQNGIIETYDTSDEMSGPVRNYRIVSKNGQIQYLFTEELTGRKRVEIGTIQSVNPRTTRFGVRANLVEIPRLANKGNLLMPFNEYFKQIPSDYRGDHIKSQYYDATDFLELLKPIREFRRQVLHQTITPTDEFIAELRPMLRRLREEFQSSYLRTSRESSLYDKLRHLFQQFDEMFEEPITAERLPGLLSTLREIQNQTQSISSSREVPYDVAEILNDALADLQKLNDKGMVSKSHSIAGQLLAVVMNMIQLNPKAAFAEWMSAVDIALHSGKKSEEHVEVKVGGVKLMLEKLLSMIHSDVQIKVEVMQNPRWGQAMTVDRVYDPVTHKLMSIAIQINPNVSLDTLRRGAVHEVFHTLEAEPANGWVEMKEEFVVTRRTRMFLSQYGSVLQLAIEAAGQAVHDTQAAGLVPTVKDLNAQDDLFSALWQVIHHTKTADVALEDARRSIIVQA